MHQLAFHQRICLLAVIGAAIQWNGGSVRAQSPAAVQSPVVQPANAAMQALPPIQVDHRLFTTVPASAQLKTAANQNAPPPETIPAPPSAPPKPDRAPMTLDELESMALGNNPTLAQASARVRALRGAWEQAGLYPNPRIQYKGDEMGDENRAGFQGASVMQEIVTKHKLARAQDVVSQQVRQADDEYAAQEMRVRNDVKLRFYEVLLAAAGRGDLPRA